jgi:hypothetical protein
LERMTLKWETVIEMGEKQERGEEEQDLPD